MLQRADYWKSQERKYCDFCKCWIADNKPSVEFHEKGRRHKENVSKRLKAIQKKTKRDEKETVRIDSAIQQMESAALEAYRRDMESNADLTSISLNKRLRQDEVKTGKHLWHEVRSQGGEISYRNVLTDEIVWKSPLEGYLTIAEQKLASFETTKKQMKLVHKHQLLEGRLRWEQLKREEEEERARIAREKLKERKAEDLPVPVYAPLLPTGPSTPYGAWQVVKTQEVKEIDWQLPQQEEYLPPVVSEPEPEPAPREFKEKTIESLGSGSTSFKKRKTATVAKRNQRQRVEDD